MSEIEHKLKKYFVYGGMRNGQAIDIPESEVGYEFVLPIQGERLTEREYQALPVEERESRFETYKITSDNEVEFVGKGK